MQSDVRRCPVVHTVGTSEALSILTVRAFIRRASSIRALQTSVIRFLDWTDRFLPREATRSAVLPWQVVRLFVSL